MNRSGLGMTMAAATILASMPMHVARVANRDGDDVLIVGGDVEDAVLGKESELTRLSREADEQIMRGRYVKQNKQPDPARQSAAEAKRARKSAELKRLAEKGAIGVQTAKAPTKKNADKTKTPAKRKAPTKKPAAS